MVNTRDAGPCSPRHRRRVTGTFPRSQGEMAMTTRTAKIIPFPSKQRHLRVRLTSTGEWLRLIAGGRKPHDEGPRAA